MISVLTVRHRFTTFSNFDCPSILPTNFLTGSLPKPIPAQECKVVPPMLTAAIPVLAVIANVSEAQPPHDRMISRSSTDFPVPKRLQLKKGKVYNPCLQSQ